MAKKKKPDTSTPESTPNLPELNSSILYALVYGDRERDKDLYLSAIDTLLSSGRTSAKISELYQNLLSSDTTVSVAANKSLDQLISRTVRQLKNVANIEEANKKIQEVKEQVKASEVEKKVARAKRVKAQTTVAKEPESTPAVAQPTPPKRRKSVSDAPTPSPASKKPKTKKTKSVGEVGTGSIISAIENTTPELPNTVDIGESIAPVVTPTVEPPVVSTVNVGESLVSEVTNAALSKEQTAKNMGLESKGGNIYGPKGRNVGTHRFQNGQFVPIRKYTQSPTPGNTVVPPTPSSEGEAVAPSAALTARDKRKGRGRKPTPKTTPTGGTITPPSPSQSSGGGATPPPTPPPVGGTAAPPPPPPPGGGGAPNIQQASVLGALLKLIKSVLPLGGRLLRKVFKRKPPVQGQPKSPMSARKMLRKNRILRTGLNVLRGKSLINSILKGFNISEKELKKALKDTSDVLNKIAGLFEKFVNDIRKIQLKFGVNAGTALNIKFGSMFESAKSYFDSIASGFKKAPVSSQQIQDVSSAFQQEFGGVLANDAAVGIAERGVRLGLTPEMQAKARRTFITTTLGDREQAVAAEERFMKEFETKGLSGGEALKIAAEYSELIARNGNRFATSFVRAAADAKKIGVSLQNVDKIGDNIIGNFEGFLEAQAELGAMGFGFDSNRLAELAETGDTGMLFNELRSQLASTGKDITKLRRSEQLALSEAFGISMEDIQRLAGKTSGSGEKTRTDLFESMNNVGSRIVNALDVSSVILSGIASMVTGIFYLMKLNSPITGMLMGVLSGLAGILIALTSIISAFQFGKEKNIIGAGGSILGGIVGGAMIGSAIPVIGTAVGAVVGGVLAAGSAAYGYSKADDMMSKSGYGERALVTPKGVVSLNNSDNIIAYADDMMATQAGIETMPKGEIVKESSKQVQQINIDLSKLEAKLDKVTAAIANMGIYMDGNKVGKILVNNSDVNSIGVFRTQAKATL